MLLFSLLEHLLSFGINSLLPKLSKFVMLSKSVNKRRMSREHLMGADPRGERLQIMLTKTELTALDNWRFTKRMPTRAAAIRELLRRGLSAEGFEIADGDTKSGDFSVVEASAKTKNGKAPRAS